MLLNEVVLGKQKVLTQNTPSLTKASFWSVFVVCILLQ